jgi:hypothetical protein
MRTLQYENERTTKCTIDDSSFKISIQDDELIDEGGFAQKDINVLGLRLPGGRIDLVKISSFVLPARHVSQHFASRITLRNHASHQLQVQYKYYTSTSTVQVYSRLSYTLNVSYVPIGRKSTLEVASPRREGVIPGHTPVYGTCWPTSQTIRFLCLCL